MLVSLLLLPETFESEEKRIEVLDDGAVSEVEFGVKRCEWTRVAARGAENDCLMFI